MQLTFEQLVESLLFVAKYATEKEVLPAIVAVLVGLFLVFGICVFPGNVWGLPIPLPETPQIEILPHRIIIGELTPFFADSRDGRQIYCCQIAEDLQSDGGWQILVVP